MDSIEDAMVCFSFLTFSSLKRLVMLVIGLFNIRAALVWMQLQADSIPMQIEHRTRYRTDARWGYNMTKKDTFQLSVQYYSWVLPCVAQVSPSAQTAIHQYGTSIKRTIPIVWHFGSQGSLSTGLKSSSRQACHIKQLTSALFLDNWCKLHTTKR